MTSNYKVPKKNVMFRIDPTLYASAKEIAEARGRRITAEVETFLRRYVALDGEQRVVRAHPRKEAADA